MGLFNRIKKYNLIDTRTGEVKGSQQLSPSEAYRQNKTVVTDSQGGRAWVDSEWDYDPSDAAVQEWLDNH
jgi:hypothetical protein